MEQGLPRTWVVFEACRKCGATVPKIEYISDKPELTEVAFGSTDMVASFRCQARSGEHFHAHCWRCGVRWEALMDGTHA